MPDEKPEEMFNALMCRTERMIGINRAIAAMITELQTAGVQGDVIFRVAAKVSGRVKELSK